MKRVVEIGALRGETTVKMFEDLGSECELHVIDPDPRFDPTEHQERFGGRYVFHRDLSLNVLPGLPPMDVALVDGDHNWYTVYNELKQLWATAREAGEPLPLLILHDVGWPYGRRDLYYEPSQIPEEFRQPYERAGMAQGRIRLLREGGMNDTLCNAYKGGGPRNGVRTGLEDFVAEYPGEIRTVILPIYFGLAIVVAKDRLNDATARFLDRLEDEIGDGRLLRLAENIRLSEQVLTHNMLRNHTKATSAFRDRWLGLLKAALLDQHYLENEVRIAHLLAKGSDDVTGLRDPERDMPLRFDRLANARAQGGQTGDRRSWLGFLPYTDMGRPALDHLEAVVRDLADSEVAGDVLECAVGRGGGGVFLRAALDAFEMPDRAVIMADRYMASVQPESDEAGGLEQFRPDLNQVRDAFDRFDLLDSNVSFLAGDYKTTIPQAGVDALAVLRVGATAGRDLGAILRTALPMMVEGGTVIVEGTGSAPCQASLEKVRADLGVTEPVTSIDWNTTAWTVGSSPVGPVSQTAGELSVAAVPRRGAAETDVDLTVVVVTYNMRREGPRTLRSLSRSYQQGIDDLSYEVLVLDNGSSPEGALTHEEVEAFGPEFRLIEMGEAARPSPTLALNEGIRQARGRAIALMIDGAHVLTPGVLRWGMSALDTYSPAIVATQQWYVGPGQQVDAGHTGYDQAAEDKLFNRISWPTDGYRLFEIGHFIGDRDWFDGIVESNCLFVPRELLEQVGGFDDAFDMPGAGYANLELYERLGSHPGVTVASILGEGSFHQFHGGTTTNVADEAERRNRIFGYREHYAQVKGRELLGVNDPVHFVGSMATKAARRTRSRREINLALDPQRDPVDSTSTDPHPVPEELQVAGMEALWQNQAWRSATWLGRKVNRFPTDLHAYQELVSAVSPDVVLVIGDDDGLMGRALYVASVLDQLGAGEVIAVGASASEEAHSRVSAFNGDPLDPEVSSSVVSRVGERSSLVLVGLGASDRVLGAFGLYSPLVPVGSYVVIENTVLNGRPVEPAFGLGPHEAVTHVLGSSRNFIPDVAFEKYTFTFNKGGFLRRMSDS